MQLLTQRTTENGWRRFARRPSPASLVSIVAHVILGIVVLQAVQMPAVFDRFLQVDRKAGPLAEKVEFVNVAPVIVEKEEPNATEHQYYRNNDAVRDDIVDVLKGVSGDDIPNRTFRPEKRYYRLG